MRGARSSIAGLALLVAAQALAAEDSAPLESTKRELRQLEATQKNKSASGPADGVKVATPTLDVQLPESPVIQQWTDRKKAEERVDRQQKRKSENWLLNGMEQQEQAGKAATDEGQGAEPTVTGVDPSDPGYLLKLFDEQKKQPDGKEAAAKPHAAPAPDPFAPFLQSWLGTSPVKNQVMDQFRKGTEPPGTLVVPNQTEHLRAPEAAVAALTNPTPAPGQASAPKPNPYLVDLAPLPGAPRDMVGGTAPLADVDRALAAPLPAMTPPAPIAPLPDVRTPAKGPPPSPADDKKYFPQLNKF